MDEQEIVSTNHSRDNDLTDVQVINEINYDGDQYLPVSAENTNSNVDNTSANKNNLNENTKPTPGTTLFSPSSNSFTIREMDFDFESLHMLHYWSKEELVAYISKLMNWLIDCIQKTHLLESVTPNISRQIYYISCVLWLSQQISCDLSCVLTVTIFNVLLDWTLSSLEPKYKLMKLAVDRVLCSMYAIQPDLFSNLLERLGIILPIVDTSTKDCNDVRHHQFKFLRIQQPCSDPYDISRLANGHSLNIPKNVLHTLSTISLSYTSSDQLISSGFLALLIDLVISFIEVDEETNEENPSGRQISKNPTMYFHSGFKVPELHNMSIYNKFSQPATFRSHLSSLKGVKSNMFFSLRNISRTSFPTGTAYLKSPLAKQDKHADVSANKSKLLEDDLTRGVLDLESCDKDEENDLTLTKENTIIGSTVMNSDTVSAILIFFSELSWQNCIKTWLGSENICVFWERLLRYLCITIPLNKNDCKYLLKNKMTTNSVLKLENAAITFFRKCCSCHPRNQQKFAQILYNILTQMTSTFTRLGGLMDFTRRILLELVVEIDSVNIYVETDEENIFGIPEFDESFLLPPAFPLSTKHKMFYFRTDYTCSDIIKQILISNSISPVCQEGSSSTPKRSAESEVGSTFEVIKKIKLTNGFQISKEDLEAAGSSKDAVVQRAHPKLLFWSPIDNQYIKISQSSMIADVLRIFVPSGDELDVPVLKCYVSRHCDGDNDEICLSSDYKIPPTMVFKEFVELQGVELIVHYIEMRPQKMVAGTASMKKRVHFWNKMPMHSLIAFGLFLRLPEYRNLNQVCRILRSVYGFREEANFNLEKHSDCFLSDNPSMLLRPLGVLPYELLGHCFKENTSRLDENSRLFILIDFLLMYLALCTRQPESVLSAFIETEDEVFKIAIQQCFSSIGNLQRRNNLNTFNYWPKGVGYNSIPSYMEPRSSIMFLTLPISERIEEEEELVTSLIQALTMYINPCPKHYTKPYSSFDQIELPAAFIDLTKKSCLRKVLISYLRNESVLDIFHRIPLYKAIMQILRVMVANSQTVSILICDEKAEDSPAEDNDPVSIVELLLNMKTCVEVYTEQLSRKFVGNQCSDAAKLESDEKDLISDIQNTATFIDTTIRNLRSLKKSVPHTTASTLEVSSALPKELLYTKMMKKLQFATFDMITETEELIEFNVEYHYCDLVLNINPVTTPARMKRLAQEVVSLRSSLPLSYESAILVRCDTDRLDVMKVLITGPPDTPYMNGCFEFDVCFPANYPNIPMLVNLRTTGRNSVRFNPNLYECGKVCLSLLNTWSGGAQEMWNPNTSNLIQVLISIQALVFVAQPYFNEPGLERQTSECDEISKDYNDRLLPHTIRWAMTDQIQNPSPCFKEVIHAHFWAKAEEIKQQVTKWINESNTKYTDQIQVEARKLFAALEQLSEPDIEF